MQTFPKLCVCVLLVSVTCAAPQSYSAPQANEYAAPMPYNFQWAVNDQYSGNDYSHTQSNDGQATQGEYRVQLPDGRLQIVTFYDNGDGYNAEVTYEGEAQYPQQQGGAGGGYSAPQNSYN